MRRFCSLSSLEVGLSEKRPVKGLFPGLPRPVPGQGGSYERCGFAWLAEPGPAAGGHDGDLVAAKPVGPFRIVIAGAPGFISVVDIIKCPSGAVKVSRIGAGVGEPFAEQRAYDWDRAASSALRCSGGQQDGIMVEAAAGPLVGKAGQQVRSDVRGAGLLCGLNAFEVMVLGLPVQAGV